MKTCPPSSGEGRCKPVQCSPVPGCLTPPGKNTINKKVDLASAKGCFAKRFLDMDHGQNTIRFSFFSLSLYFESTEYNCASRVEFYRNFL